MNRLDKVLRTLQTARHLRPSQIRGQLRRRLVGPARSPRRPLAPGIDDIRFDATTTGPSAEGSVDEHGSVSLLAQPHYDPLGRGWRERHDPLWTYTLHYHGWLTQLSPDDAEATMLSWIAEHRAGVGWEPYPTSMRLLHWLGWLFAHGAHRQAGPRERILDSMAAQLEHLAGNVETHIDGNHLWTNLAALSACGLGLRGPLARSVADDFCPRFEQVVREQLYPDGVHRERTPSYHCVLAEQLAIVVDIARATRPPAAAALERSLLAMVDATASFSHPDGDVALFGDSRRGAPVTPATLRRRLARPDPGGHATNPDGGFARRQWGPFSVLWTLGGVGLPWQPGHIHADALAIEVSLDRTRIVVDAGVGSYRRGRSRRYVRSTRAHNTATVGLGEPNQHEVWASHRIARRAEPRLEDATATRVTGVVRGVDSEAMHRRQIDGTTEGFLVRDLVEPWGPATVRWFVPATARVSTDAGHAVIRTEDGAGWELHTNVETLALARADGWLGFGRPAKRICLAATIPREGLVSRFSRSSD